MYVYVITFDDVNFAFTSYLFLVVLVVVVMSGFSFRDNSEALLKGAVGLTRLITSIQ